MVILNYKLSTLNLSGNNTRKIENHNTTGYTRRPNSTQEPRSKTSMYSMTIPLHLYIYITKHQITSLKQLSPKLTHF